MLTVHAPGKIMLLGEYSVLHGGPALMVAVDAYATCAVHRADETYVSSVLGEQRPGAEGALPLARAVLEQMEVAPARYHLDSHALGTDTTGAWTKLGLGSSAATTAALVGAVQAARGEEIDVDEIHTVARAAHRVGQGGGSGADVAACCYGGALSFTMDRAPLKLATPKTELLTVWTGQAASTPQFLAKVRGYAQAHPGQYQALMTRLSDAARFGINAYTREDRTDLCRAAEETTDGLKRLSALSNAPIVTDVHRALEAIARRFDAVAKPTGAGGGDLAWLLARDAEAEPRLAQAVQDAGFLVFWWTVPTRGVHRQR